MLRCIIFTRGRAGSGSLLGALAAHRCLTAINEPFNRELHDGRYKADSSEELQQKLRVVWQDYNLIKHAWAEDGWPFGGAEADKLNAELLLQPNQSVIVLNRRNVLQRFVSRHLALHSGSWTPDDPDAISRIQSSDYPPIRSAELEARLESELLEIANYTALLQEHKQPFFELWYEDLYDPSVAIDQRLELYERILEFLGLSRTAYCEKDVRHFLAVDGRKLASAGAYHLIPEITGIEERLASPSTGSLFNPRRVGPI